MPTDDNKAKAMPAGHQVMDRAVEILTAYLSNPTTHLNHKDIPEAYRAIRDVLREELDNAPTAENTTEAKPAVPVKKSVFDDRIVCLECGQNYKSLKRHIGQAHGLTVPEYKAKWALPDDYPTVAKDYSETRSRLAVQNNLGEQGRLNRKKTA